MFRQKRDIHDADLAFPMRQIQSPDRLPRSFDYLKGRAGIILPVMGRLRIELSPAENSFLFVAPAGHGQFLSARARIKPRQK
jgi:hypothetical protein